LKSSAKITLVPKPSKRSSIQNRAVSTLSSPSRSATASPSQRSESPFHLPPSEPVAASNATWVCPICTFSNPVPSNFDPATATIHTPLPPCLACGIKPPLTHVLKAAISNVAHRPAAISASLQTPIPIRARTESIRPHSEVLSSSSTQATAANETSVGTGKGSSLMCPRCTFLNHPSLISCELCGAPLIAQGTPSHLDQQIRPESPGPTLATPPSTGPNALESIKVSFRSGGEKIFHERLKDAMTQRKWLLQGAPPVPKPGGFSSTGVDSGSSSPVDRVKTVGIAGLEQRRLDMRKNNEVVIGNAFEDLEALMASAKEIIALAESFARQSNGAHFSPNQPARWV